MTLGGRRGVPGGQRGQGWGRGGVEASERIRKQKDVGAGDRSD